MLLSQLRHGGAERDERGVAMVVAAVLVVLCATVSMVVASSTMFGTQQTAADRTGLQALAAAEAGRDQLLAELQSSPAACPASRSASGSVGTASYTASAAWAASVSAAPADSCPTDGTIRITATGTAPGGAAKTVVAFYPWAADRVPRTTTATATVTATTTSTTTTTVATAQGAIIQGSSASKALNIPTVVVNNGDLLAASTGIFDCNSNSIINGDLIVPNGSISLSNNCTVNGNVYAKGAIKINNLGNRVRGDVVSATGGVTISHGSVDGSVRAAGIIDITTSATVGGNVVSASTKASTIYNSTIGGSISVAGTFSSLQSTHVTGNVTAAGTGASAIAPDTSIGGDLKLGGSLSTWNDGPDVDGTVTTGVSDLPKPTVTAPAAMSRSTWLEIPWRRSSWTAAGWDVVTATAADCDYQSTPALVTAIDDLTHPTVIDATACGTSGLDLYGVTFKLQTNVTFVASAFDSAQNLKVGVSGTGQRSFNLIVPDPTPTDNAPTCPAGSAGSTVYGAVLAAGVSGMAYSPCTLGFGTVSWTGQIIAGDPDPSGGNVTLDYQNIGVPGATAGAGAGTATLTATATATTTTTVTRTTTTTPSAPPSMAPSLIQQREP